MLQCDNSERRKCRMRSFEVIAGSGAGMARTTKRGIVRKCLASGVSAARSKATGIDDYACKRFEGFGVRETRIRRRGSCPRDGYRGEPRSTALRQGTGAAGGERQSARLPHRARRKECSDLIARGTRSEYSVTVRATRTNLQSLSPILRGHAPTGERAALQSQPRVPVCRTTRDCPGNEDSATTAAGIGPVRHERARQAATVGGSSASASFCRETGSAPMRGAQREETGGGRRRYAPGLTTARKAQEPPAAPLSGEMAFQATHERARLLPVTPLNADLANTRDAC